MDHLYSYPGEILENIRAQKAWMADPKYFKKVQVCPSASIKMLMHGQQGVEKGIRKAGKPIEVMGLLMGRPDVDNPHNLIITDAFPLPIEGFETRVVADDDNVTNYMIELGESMEITRHERFCGWYHTHPFDLDGTSHCFLSNTDITTQLQWQRGEDPHGNPWLAIVIDPLLSIARGAPEMMAFRVYPPEYTAPADETPNGQIIRDDHKRIEMWGACWNRYYKLEIEYFMSSMTAGTLNALRNKFLWYNPLCTTDASASASATAGIANVSRLIRNVAPRRYGSSGGGGYEEEDPEATGTGGGATASKEKPLKAASTAANAVAAEHTCRMCSLLTKQALFGLQGGAGICMEDLTALQASMLSDSRDMHAAHQQGVPAMEV